ncbi:MAG: DUF2460 domain-containing protein, partial [Pseudomonadota bacterium]
MTGFHEVQFPMRLAIGAIGGPERRTEIVTLASGKEVRNAKWSGSRRRWEIGSAITDLADLQDLLSFFEARQGRLYGFRFRDPLDFSSASPNQLHSATDQVLGEGDGTRTQFQLIKDYGGVTRRIAKPVAETVELALDANPAASGWQLDPTMGTVTFNVPPPARV